LEVGRTLRRSFSGIPPGEEGIGPGDPRSAPDRSDRATIGEAPEIAQSAKYHLGGLISGQLLFLPDPDDDPLVYCAWWPWGSGRTISIRIGLFSAMMGTEEKGAVTETLKGWFGA
jgi:hypothetical protein